MPETELSYWLGGDDTQELGQDPGKRPALKARLLHALLYEPHLVIADSYWVNNRNLRWLCEHDPLIRDVLREGWIRIARRTRGSDPIPLCEVRDHFRRIQDNPSEKTFPSEEYGRDEGLLFLEENARVCPYSLDEVSRRFTVEIRRILSEEIAEEKLSERIAHAIRGCVEIRIKDLEEASRRGDHSGGSYLEFAWFYYGDRGGKLWELLDQFCGPDTFKEHEEEILDLAKAVYVTGLPEKIGAAPVYPPHLAEPIRIWRRRRTRKKRRLGNARTFRTPLGLTTYEGCLQALDLELFQEFRESSEWCGYRACLAGVQARERKHDELAAALFAYRERVELRMAETLHLPDRGEEGEIRMQAELQEGAGGELEWLAFKMVDLFSGVPFLSDFLRVIYTKLGGRDRRKLELERIAREERLAAARLEEARSAAIEEAQARSESPIRSELTVSSQDLHDIQVG